MNDRDEDQIENIDGENETASPKYNFKWMIALLLVGMIGSFLFPSIKNKQPINHIIYTENFEVYPDELTTIARESSDANKSELIEAMSYYNQGKYRDGISLFEEYEGDLKLKSIAKFYHAISLLAISRIESGNEILQQLSSDQLPMKIDDSMQWYLALSHLRLGKYDKVKNILSELPLQHYKYKEAQIILEKLK